MIELLVVIAIIAILFAIVLVAVQRTREAARKTACREHLYQIGLAILGYDQQRQALPVGRDATDGREHSWATAVLPFLDQGALAERYDRSLAWNEGSNLAVAETDLDVFLCPSTARTWRGATDYGGNYGSSITGIPSGFGIDRAWDSGMFVAVGAASWVQVRKGPITMDHIRDGASRTFMVLEDAGRLPENGGQWANGHQCLAHEWGGVNFHRNNGIFSDHASGAHALLADGSVQFVSEDVEKAILGALSTRANQEVLDEAERGQLF